MSGFPINLDLSEYFDDLRKYSSIFINSSKFKDVRDVENHIRSVFGLEDNICLVQKKFLIPKSEDIKILQQYDIFKVQKCNFYDLQIHKTKKVINNSSCDQKALNLTQAEKTIDLSCRPKQRLKANTCPSPGVSGTLSLLIDHKKCTDSQTTLGEQTVLLNGSQNMQKDKSKSKKKKYSQNDLSHDENDVGNILDMSVNNSLRKKHSNCFSTDDGSLLSDGVNDINQRDIAKNHHKKSKKRKKNSEGVDDVSVDLSSTFWESLVHDNASSKDPNIKKKPKRAKESILNDSFSTDKPSVKSEFEAKDFVNNKTTDDECSARKKHKHCKKYEESKINYNSEENQYYSSSPMHAFKNHKKSGAARTCFEDKKNERNSESNTLEEHKKEIKRQIDQMLTGMHKNSTDLNCQNEEEDINSAVSSNSQTTSDNNLKINHQQSSVAENIKQESSTGIDYNNPKRKRKRKRNKIKSKEKLSYMLAIGPTINQLAAQPVVTKLSPSNEISKHVFFTEDDFVEDMTVPPTPPVKPQTVTESSQPVSSQVDVAQSQGQSSSLPSTWQDHLLKLASSGSKPFVFHRNTTSVATISPKVTANSNQANVNTAGSLDQLNPVADDVTSCKTEAKESKSIEENSVSGTVDGCSPRKGLPDVCKPQADIPIPNDLQNINLSDYPIIDKVVAEDLILFKVLKLNENGEPGVSKPVLARVSDTSNFPDKITLQIMEGCEECSHCTQSEGSEEPFNLELRWCDILEPRLFYP